MHQHLKIYFSLHIKKHYLLYVLEHFIRPQFSTSLRLAFIILKSPKNNNIVVPHLILFEKNEGRFLIINDL